jgi:hypothetical protein
MDRQLVQKPVESADEPAKYQRILRVPSIFLHTQELSDTEITRGASREERLNELYEPEPLVGVVDKPCSFVSLVLSMYAHKY